MRTSSHAVTQEESWGTHRKLKWGLISLRQHESFTKVPFTPRVEPQASRVQLEKNHDIPSSTWDEAQYPCRSSRSILSSLSELESRLDSFYAIQEIPQNTRCNSRGTPSFPWQLEKNPVLPTSSQTRADSRDTTLEEFQLSPSHLKRRPVSPIEPQEEPHLSFCNSKGHRVPPQLEIRPDYPVPTWMELWISPHNMKGGLTDLLQV